MRLLRLSLILRSLRSISLVLVSLLGGLRAIIPSLVLISSLLLLVVVVVVSSLLRLSFLRGRSLLFINIHQSSLLSSLLLRLSFLRGRDLLFLFFLTLNFLNTQLNTSLFLLALLLRVSVSHLGSHYLVDEVPLAGIIWWERREGVRRGRKIRIKENEGKRLLLLKKKKKKPSLSLNSSSSSE